MSFCSACARIGSLLSPFVLILNQYSPLAIYILTGDNKLQLHFP